MNRNYNLVIFILILPLTANAAHLHTEAHYQRIWCSEQGGITEYVLNDKSRVDCLTDEYAVEVEFASKWKESVGQSLYYGIKTERKPGILLIMENETDTRSLNKLKIIGEKYNIRIWIIAP